MKQLLQDLCNQWWSRPLPPIQPRKVDLHNYFDPRVKKIISVVGFRRVGKTFAMLDFAQKYGKDNCLYLNFEDERLPKDASVLSMVVDLLTELKGEQPFVLLMDEIQEMPDWSLWARRVNETTPHRLILSGSSSKLSSREIPTELRGQTIQVPMFPLDWEEFLSFKNIDLSSLTNHQKLMHLREYLQFGGLPEIVLVEEGLRSLILTEYFSTFVDRDIVERYKLRKKEVLTDLLRLLPNTHEYTYAKLTRTMGSFGHQVSKSTIIRYLKWLEGSFFLSHLEVFSANAKTRIQATKKMYLLDTFFSSHLTSSASLNTGHLMEQVVANRLHQASIWDPRLENYYWRDKMGHEVDFVRLINKRVDELIQVTFATNEAEVQEREILALLKAAKKLKLESGVVVTWDYKDEKVYDGVKVSFVPLHQWLLTTKG